MSLWASIRKELAAIKYLINKRIYVSPKIEKDIIESFHKLLYGSDKFGQTFANTYWLGVPMLKNPLDAWTYQEILYELKPDLIVECGTNAGGGAFYFASICDLIGKGEVITIDIEENSKRPKHQRITYLMGSSTSPEIVKQVKRLAESNQTVMVVLDSDHSKEHVLNELRAYSEVVTKGSYLVVEDTDINGHPVMPEFGPGPMEALEEFLKENRDFEIDKKREKFLVTFHPNGFLKKIS